MAELTQWGMTETEYNAERDARLCHIRIVGVPFVEDGVLEETIQPGDTFTLDLNNRSISFEFGPDHMHTFLGHDHSLCDEDDSEQQTAWIPEARFLLAQWHDKHEAEHGCVAHDEGLSCCVDKFLEDQ